jgi:glycosyltransferase involved in cell wall biosynthesis
MTKIPVLIVISPIISGVVSWALRVREAFARNEVYEVRLVSLGGGDDGTMRFDYSYDDPRRIIRLMEHLGSGVIVPNYLWGLHDLIGEAIAAGSDWRILGYCRADSKQEYYDPLLQRADLISHFVAVSPVCASTLQSVLPERREDITMLPTGVDRAADPSGNETVGPLRLTWAGRVVQHQKRVLDLALIAHRLDERSVDYELQIVGDGEERVLLQQCLTEQCAQGRVKFCGRVPPGQMHEIWRATDVVLLCSEFEGTSNSILEAMGCGCVPVVTRTDSGVEGIVDQGVNGLLFEIGDVPAAVDHLQYLASNSEFMRNARRAAWESVAPFSIENHAAVLLQLFDRLMQHPPRRQQVTQHVAATALSRAAARRSAVMGRCRSIARRIWDACCGRE